MSVIMRQHDKNSDSIRYLTQQEVADRFRVSESTVKNWRERGLLDYFQAPGSTRVLYPVSSVEEFERQSTKRQREVVKATREIQRERPRISIGTKKDWRI
jgi:hypothetical protein